MEQDSSLCGRHRGEHSEESSWPGFGAFPQIKGHAVWDWHIPADTVSYSKEWRHILRDPNDAVLGPATDAWWPRMHEEDVAPFVQAARDVVHGRTDHYRALSRVRRADGAWAWLFSRGVVAERADGKAVRVLGAMMDVSELHADIKFLHGNVGMRGVRNGRALNSEPHFIVRMDRILPSLTRCDDFREEPSRRGFTAFPQIRDHATWDWHIPADIITYSREWRRILRDPDDATPEPGREAWWPRLHEEDVAPFIQAARDVVYGHTDHYNSLFRVRRADGTWAWLLSRGVVTERAEGKAVRILGAVMDVSELNVDIKFLHGSAASRASRHDQILDSGPDFIVRMDRNLSPLTRNPLIGNMLAGDRPGAGPPEENAAPRISPEQLSYFKDNIEHIFSTGIPVRETISFPTSYGHDVIGEYAFCPEFDTQGRITSVVVQFRDVTEQILAERRAHLNEMRLNSLYRLAQMDSADEQSVLHFVMDSMIRLTGSEHGFLLFPGRISDEGQKIIWSESLHNSIKEAGLSEDRFFARYCQPFIDECLHNGYRAIKNGNSLHPVQEALDGRLQIMRYLLVSAAANGKLVCIAGVANKNTDYTTADLQQTEAFINGAWLVVRRHELVRELQRAKETAEQSREAAERANKGKDEFLANISHELRTPLNGILGMLQLLELSPLNEQQRAYTRTADSSGQALLRIISDILDFSRIESGKMRLQIEPFDFANAVETSLSLFRTEAERKGLSFTFSLGEGIPKYLLGDDARVRQIIFNIVGNAVKFTEQGGIRVECAVLPPNRADHVQMYLAVHDTGIGVSLKDQNRIFDAFTQIDSSSTRKYPGTGLGLSIVRHLVDLMGGTVALESVPGRGTSVYCRLRFARCGDGHMPLEARERLRRHSGGGPLHILVAEDDEVSRYAIQTFLQRLGHTAVCAPNGRLALELLQLHDFHCLLTDIQMPDMDGLEVLDRIRKNRLDDIPPTDNAVSLLRESFPAAGMERRPVRRDIIAVTTSAHAMKGDRERFLAAGMDYYIAKPVAMKELSDVLQDVFARLADDGS